tara:strand:+ start:3187 stop:3696 length:510 start_codon:yes stop_codon:yes gene_type:complete
MKFKSWFQPVEPDPRPPRIVLAEAVRQFASGTISNDDLENRTTTLSASDSAIDAIDDLTWFYYDDFYEHKLRGRHRLSKVQRQMFARCVLFLRSDLEYEYPRNARSCWVNPRSECSWIRSLFRSLFRLTLDAATPSERPELIDDRIWPFKSRSDYNEALRHPVYLTGAA